LPVDNNVGNTNWPNRICSGKLDHPTIHDYLDQRCFPTTPIYSYGSAGRNELYGPGVNNVDFTRGVVQSLQSNRFRDSLEYAQPAADRPDHNHQYGIFEPAGAVRAQAALLTSNDSCLPAVFARGACCMVQGTNQMLLRIDSEEHKRLGNVHPEPSKLNARLRCLIDAKGRLPRSVSRLRWRKKQPKL
jgi:hypothetical protein